MSNREALVAVLVAFVVGAIGALSLRPASDSSAAPIAESAAAQDRGPTLRWRITSAFGTQLPALGENPVQIADRLRLASSGRIDWTIDDPGEVVPAFSIVDAVRVGKIEAGYTWLGYDQGKLAASVLFGSVPFGMTDRKSVV